MSVHALIYTFSTACSAVPTSNINIAFYLFFRARMSRSAFITSLWAHATLLLIQLPQLLYNYWVIDARCALTAYNSAYSAC